MAVVVDYQTYTAPDGTTGYVAIYDNGQREYFTADGLSLGYANPNVAMLPTSMQPPATQPQPAPAPRMQRPLPPPEPMPEPMPSPRGGVAPSGGRPITEDYFFDAAGYGAVPDLPLQSAGGGGGVSSFPASLGAGGLGGRPNPYTAIGGGGGYGAAPLYADGSQHPLQGGSFRTPGGPFAQQSSGVDTRRQMNVPGGAKAGPFEISAAPLPKTPARGGYAVDKLAYSRGNGAQSGDGGGGGGSLAKSLYYSYKNKLEGKLQPGLSDQQYQARQQRQYNRQGRKMDATYGGTSSGVYEDGVYLGTGEEKMRGFSKHIDPRNAYGFYYRPSGLLPKAAPGLPSGSSRYADIAAMPAGQLSMLVYGGKKKAKEGPSQYVNNLAKFYGDVANENAFYSYDTLIDKLGAAKGRSMLGQQFKKQPYGIAAGNLESMLGAIFNSSLDETSAGVQSSYASRLMDEYASKYAKKKPKNTPMMNSWIAERL